MFVSGCLVQNRLCFFRTAIGIFNQMAKAYKLNSLSVLQWNLFTQDADLTTLLYICYRQVNKTCNKSVCSFEAVQM